MSIANESGNYDAYKRLKFVEFLDLLCRVTVHIFKEHKAQDLLPFHRQLEYTIDQILWRVGLHRNCPKIHWMPAEETSDLDTDELSDRSSDVVSAPLDSQSSIPKAKKRRGFKQLSTLIRVVEPDKMSFSSIDLSEEESKTAAGGGDRKLGDSATAWNTPDKQLGGGAIGGGKATAAFAVNEEEDDDNDFDDDY